MISTAQTPDDRKRFPGRASLKGFLEIKRNREPEEIALTERFERLFGITLNKGKI